MTKTALCLGYGYVAHAFAASLAEAGWTLLKTRRAPSPGVIAFADGKVNDELRHALRAADAVLVSIPPDADGDPGLKAVEAAGLKPGAWVGYLSTTGVYGDRGGGWVCEDSALAATAARSVRRIAAERGWARHGAQLFRLAGIYGPGRSALDRLRAGDAQRIIKPGQVFSRIHVDDIVSALRLSMTHPAPGRAYNLCDDEPAPPQDAIAFAAHLLGVPPPPETPFDAATLSPMAASFYADNRRVSNARAKAELGWRPRYPSYREGLTAILAAEGAPTNR